MLSVLAEVDWNSLLLDEPYLLAVVAVWVLVAGVVLGAIIAVQWRKVQQAKYEAGLKEQMLERGFTADEIISVINAGASRGRVGKLAGRVTETPNVPCCPQPHTS